MEMLKKIGVLLLLGFVVGSVIASLIAPSFLSWYNTGADVNAMCNCTTVAKATSSQLIRAQFTGGAIGAVLTTILGVILLRMRAPPAVKPS